MGLEEIISYLLLSLNGKASEEQEEQICRWLSESDEHKREYEQFCKMYYRLHNFHQWNKIDVLGATGKVKARLEKNSVIPKWGYWLSGVAAFFAICLGISLLMNPSEPTIPVAGVGKDMKSGEKKAVLTLADGRKVELDSKRIVMDLGHVTAEGDSLSGLVYTRVKDSVEITPEYNTLSVPRGGEYILTLSDGTKVWLNSETEFRYPVVFTQNLRTVYISGEAYFDVVKDQHRPFIVNTSATRTIVHGTSFNVMAYKGEQSTEITLVRGSVTVSAGKQSRQIVPGQQIQVDNSSMKILQREVNVGYYTSWKDGLFDFSNMPLDKLCVQLGRWYDVNFFFVNTAAGSKKFTGAIKRNNTLQFMLDFIEKTSDVRFEVKGNVISVYNR